jgi:hypothetical protein
MSVAETKRKQAAKILKGKGTSGNKEDCYGKRLTEECTFKREGETE